MFLSCLFEDNFVFSYSFVKVVFKLNVKVVGMMDKVKGVVGIHWVAWFWPWLDLRIKRSTIESPEKEQPPPLK